MTSPPPNRPHQPRAAHWATWLCLLGGAVLLPFTQLQTVLPFAAWVVPVLLLRFARTTRVTLWLPGLALVYGAGSVIALRGIFEAPMIFVVGATGMVGVVPYVIDRLVARRLPALASTLAFPASAVVLEWLFSLSGLGTLGSVVNSQSSAHALGQLTSVTGMWGIIFLINWLAAGLNSAWENRSTRRVLRGVLLPVVAVLAMIILLGSLRISFTSTPTSSVRIAGLAPDRALSEAVDAPSLHDLAIASPEVRSAARAEFTPVVDELLTRTRSAARGGAKIVAWSEAAAFVLKEDEAALLDRAKAVARTEGVYLQLSVVVVGTTQQFPYAENRAIMLDPSGDLVWNYLKTVHPFNDNAVFAPGPGVVPTVTTPYGVLATIICYDADYPALVRQAGQAGADILLVPANDWQPIHTMHARAATFRAIENGVSLVRPTGSGISVAVDPLGQELSTSDWFATGRVTMITDVPTQGVGTLYRFIGDIVVYLCFGLLAILTVAALIRGRHTTARDQEETPTQHREAALAGHRD